MVFQDSPVIVENGQTAARIDVKVVGGARMVEIVDNGSHQGGEDFQIGHPVLNDIVRTCMWLVYYKFPSIFSNFPYYQKASCSPCRTKSITNCYAVKKSNIHILPVSIFSLIPNPILVFVS